MADTHLTQSALAHLGLEGRGTAWPSEAGISMGEKRVPIQIALRGEGDDATFLEAFRAALGLDLPTKPNTVSYGGEVRAFWLGPNEWLLIAMGDAATLINELSRALAGIHYALTDVSDSRAILILRGARARDLLAKATSLDLHASVFAPGDCAQSTLAQTHMLLHQLSEDATAGPVYEIFVHRSFADYAWRWLEGAAAEYGFTVMNEVEVSGAE